MTADAAPSTALSISDIQDQLSSVEGRIRAAGRRSRRFYWFAWGYLIAVIGGFIVNLFLVSDLLSTAAENGSSFSSAYPLWALLVTLLPAFALGALALRELFVGRREGLVSHSGPSARAPSRPGAGASAWTELVQGTQRGISQARSHVVSAFIPLLLGTLILIPYAAQYQIEGYTYGPYYTVNVPVCALAFLISLWPLYRMARQWMGGYQRFLDQQVGELSKLESEFLSRFTGAVASK